MTATDVEPQRPLARFDRSGEPPAWASATIAAKPSDSVVGGYDVELRRLLELAPLAREWRQLAARAVEPNVFYEPAFALSAAPVFGTDVQVALVRSRADRALVGLFPFRVTRGRYGLFPVLTGWTHPYAPLGTPLVARGQAEPIMQAMLDHLAHAPSFPSVMLLPLLPTEGPFAAALDAVLRATARSAPFGVHARALLAPSADRTTYVANAIGKKKRHELRRQRRRLEDDGPVTLRAATAPAEIGAALGDFLALEAAGWKGRAGTAAANDPRLDRFVRNAVTALAGEGKARVDRLCVGDRAVAALVTLTSGTTAWTWKIAYDEAFSRASPGVQIMVDVTETLLADPAIARADSCAATNHPMIDHLWRERLPLADRLIAVRPTPAVFSLACGLETLRRSSLGALKSLRSRLRG